MLGVVAPDDDQLPLAIEIEGVDDAEAGLARAAAGRPQLAATAAKKNATTATAIAPPLVPRMFSICCIIA